MLRIAVLVSGGGTNLQAIIDSINSGKIHNTEIAVVISNNRKAYALHRALLAAVDSYNVDLIVLAGFLVAIPEIMVKAYNNRIINIHPSLIPSFCGKGHYGLHVHEAALSRGVKVTGATVHFVDDGTDTGPIILQKPVMIEQDDTPETLQRRVMEQAEWIILPQAIDLIAQGKVLVVDGKTVIQK